MNNIWGFLLQTISVSLVAGLLLLVKWLLNDKLSPRWQYGIWSVLALRILLPVSPSRYVLLPVPLWLETLKGMAEYTFDSAFSAVYTPISVRWPIPLIEGYPQSLTDWLLVFYAAGIVITLLWYLFSYFRLRLLLRQGSRATAELQQRIEAICEKNNLNGCQAVAVPGLPSAFVCGIFSPILAAPAGKETDEKVLLHELLHLKYCDALQSILWCILRALHWCNPFLHYVFDRIGNDMESLCDQRVLERLVGEERREYGGILLDMANEHYPRAPGTTSLSNGGKNIARRIAAIVRFKKYPRGMALVSVCIAVVLACPMLMGTAFAYDARNYHPMGKQEFEKAMAMARIHRCTTVAGALDTYAKGLMYDNGIYIATASSLSQHEALAEAMRYNVESEGWVSYHLDAGDELTYVNRNDGYYIYNLRELSEGGYEGLLVFGTSAFLDKDSGGWLCDDEGNAYDKGTVLVPVTIKYEDAWVVEEKGARQTFPGISAHEIHYPDYGFPWIAQYEAIGESGTVTVDIETTYTIGNNVGSAGWSFFGGTAFDESVKTAAVFESWRIYPYVEYCFEGSDEQRTALNSVGIQVVELSSPTGVPEFPKVAMVGDISGGSNQGYSWTNKLVGEDWDRTIMSGSGGSGDFSDIDNVPLTLPYGYAARVFWNGTAHEDFILREAVE